jgi:hypothetical protein
MSQFLPPQTQFDPDAYARQTRSSGRNWLLGLLLIVLGFFTLGGILCVAGVWYVASNFDRWLVGLGREAIVAVIDESEIPAEEKSEVITQVDRVVTAYKERKIGLADLENAMTRLEEAPALKVLSLYGLDELYFTSADLTDAEIAAGRRAYQRVLRGVYEGKLNEDDVYAAFPDDADFGEGANEFNAPAAGEQVRLVADRPNKEQEGDDLREALVKLKVLADNARIPDEPFQLDIGDEVKKLVDELLAGKNGQ